MWIRWAPLAALFLAACATATPGGPDPNASPFRVVIANRPDPVPLNTPLTLRADAGTMDLSGVNWSLEAGDATRATLTGNALTIRAPGTVRVTGTAGRSTASLVLVAPDPAMDVQPLPAPASDGLTFYAGPPYIARDAAAWTRYWQAVRTKNGPASSPAPLPTPPAVDFATHAVLIVGYTYPNVEPTPVLAVVDASGAGRVEVGQPGEPHETDAPSMTTGVKVYRTPKLPVTTVVTYDCRPGLHCFNASPMPGLE